MSEQYHLQFCDGENDITADFGCEDTATEVRVWSSDGTVLVVDYDQDADQWDIGASDYGMPADTTSHRSWQAAVRAHGYGHLV